MADSAAPTSPWSNQDAVWLASAARAVSGTSNARGIDRFTAILLFIDCTARSGTSPTLNVYLQTLMPDATTWADIASFAQVTAAGQQVLGFTAGGNTVMAVTDGTLAASTVKTVPLGRKIRIKYVIAGTNPSFTFSAQIITMQ